jgi:signal peptidase I
MQETPDNRQLTTENSPGSWLKAFLLALIILVALHLFIVRWVTVQSTSMYHTLLPGDLVLVQRWPLFTGFDRNDIVVFRDPLRDKENMLRRPLLVKRLIGMPGDKVQLRDGDLFVNGEYIVPPEEATTAHLVRLRSNADVTQILLKLDLPLSMLQEGRKILELPLNETMADELRKDPAFASVTEMSTAKGAPRHIFPFSPFHPWNGDDYGPIKIPRKGDTITITIENLPIYDRIISRYEGHDLSIDDGSDVLLIDGHELKEYIIEQDYYFVLGDSRHFSADSRYWGFAPEDHLAGRAAAVIMSKGDNGLRKGRWLQGL